MYKVKRAWGIAGWILLGAVVEGVVGYVMGLTEEELSESSVVVTATVVDRNGSGALVPKVVIKNYGIAIRSGSGAVYDIVGNAPMESEYRLWGGIRQVTGGRLSLWTMGVRRRKGGCMRHSRQL